MLIALLVSSLSQDALQGLLRTSALGCVNDKYPQGRALGVVARPSAVTQALVNSLGPSGFFVLQAFGFERSPGATPPVPPQSPQAFAAQVKQELASFVSVLHKLGICVCVCVFAVCVRASSRGCLALRTPRSRTTVLCRHGIVSDHKRVFACEWTTAIATMLLHWLLI